MDEWKSGMVLEVPLAEALTEHVRSYLAATDFEPAEPGYAATVMLVRDVDGKAAAPSPYSDGGKVEVFMLQRAATMAFMPNAVVFPGGRVDPRDVDPRLPWAGPTPAAWAQELGCPEELARCIVVAAAREVFEECGVLLAGVDESQVIDDLSEAHWEKERALLAQHAKSFSEFLIEYGLVLRSDLLSLRAHWLTPVFEPRRYDTFFFAAALPQGQAPDGSTSEAVIADWVDPRWVFRQADEGRVLLLPPTRHNLGPIAEAADVKALMAEAACPGRVMLEPHVKEDGMVVLRCMLP
ncbi:MAG: NUDIX hydrolase [Eggerthellaceae bacterium]|nr:NUDIX hydrolase [Eggerthellaceae bacterium]MDR2715478.1 hypothetical protein [Coriobacteriaceae bacterium]